LSVAGDKGVDLEKEDDDVAAARWVLAIDEGLEPGRTEAFHAWLAEHSERAELIARQAALQDLARQAGLQGLAQRTAVHSFPQRAAARSSATRANENALKSRRRFLLGGAIAASVVAIGGAILIMRPPLPGSSEVYETATGEVRSVELADGSRLWLDTLTRISTRMTGARRDVTLEAGRLFVEVAHNPERPFLVHGTHFEARAVGTAFEATLFASRTGVAVREGVVRLTPSNGGPAVDLAAGQGAWIAGSGGVSRSTAAVPNIGAWRERRMVLSDRRLDAALAELSRYFERPLVVRDEQLAARRVSLSFSIADLGEDDAARIIAGVVGADIADRANDGILLSPAVSGGNASPALNSQPR
jgi:transmembrane sensor